MNEETEQSRDADLDDYWDEEARIEELEEREKRNRRDDIRLYGN